MKTHWLCLLAATLLAGCESLSLGELLHDPPPPRGPQVVGDDLRSLVAGNSIIVDEEQLAPLTVFFTEDGAMRGLRSNQYRDAGRWRIENDTVCGAWDNWQGTLNRCWEVFRIGNRITIRRVEDGGEVNATLATGNAAEL